ncbi:MAG: DNA/RNA nuclease SfsA [Myxococcota bacterium]|nr:DNA/RNA nuclease SfsA [Myxococcota bacterium]
MRFPETLVPGVLLAREKRFIAHVRLDDGRVVRAHTNNSGRMTGCSEPGSRVWLSPADRPGRKLLWTWEIVEAGPRAVVAGINTLVPNRLVAEAIEAGKIPELSGTGSLRTEVRYGRENSRADLLLEAEGERTWIEVKNVTLVRDGAACFPDAVTLRGRKHLRELEHQVEAGDRGVLFFVVQRGDAVCVAPADDIDPDYGRALRRAAALGVEILAWRAAVSPEEIVLERPLPLRLD